MSRFSPHLEILPAPQRALWNELSEVSGEFVLYGGTALSLHLAHRNSMDHVISLAAARWISLRSSREYRF